jgi:hypothetical protein
MRRRSLIVITKDQTHIVIGSHQTSIGISHIAAAKNPIVILIIIGVYRGTTAKKKDKLCRELKLI